MRERKWFRDSGYAELRSTRVPVGPDAAMHAIDENPNSRDALVMFHGTPSWSFEYRHWIYGMRATHRCLAPDLLGFGFSDRPRTGSAWDGMPASHSKTIDAWWDQVPEKDKLKSLNVVLHDFGGPVAMPWVLKNWDRIDRLILLNTWLWPFGDVDPSAPAKLRWIRTPLMKWLYLRWNFSAQMMVRMSWGKHRTLTRNLHDGFRDLFPDAASREGTWAFAEAVVTQDDYLRRLRAELEAKHSAKPKSVLILWGMADGFVTAQNLDAWTRIFKSARVVRLEEVGHFPQEEAFERTVPEVAEFLK